MNTEILIEVERLKAMGLSRIAIENELYMRGYDIIEIKIALDFSYSENLSKSQSSFLFIILILISMFILLKLWIY